MSTELIQMGMVLLVVGAAAGFSAGLFGIGGGAIIVPALYYAFGVLGYSQDVSMHCAVATSAATIIVTSLRSAHAHHKKGAVDWSLVWAKNPLKSWGLWIGFGAFIGAFLISSWLSGEALVLIFSVFIAAISMQFIFGRPDWRLAPNIPAGLAPPIGGSALGALCALMGIGFGSIGVTLMVLFGKSIHKAIATAAALGFFIGVPATLGYILSGYGTAGRPALSLGYVNILGFVVIAGASFFFAPIGAKMAHRLSQEKLRMVFGVCLLLVAINMLRKILLA